MRTNGTMYLIKSPVMTLIFIPGRCFFMNTGELRMVATPKEALKRTIINAMMIMETTIEE